MIEISISDESYRTEWDKYVSQHPESTVYHLFNWGDVYLKTFNIKSVFITAFENDNIRGVFPLFHLKDIMLRNFLCTGLFGSYGDILADKHDITERLFQYAVEITEKEKCKYILIKNYKSEISDMTAMKGYVTDILTLDGDVGRIWQGFNAKLRNQIRKAEQNNLKVVTDNENVNDFYYVLSSNIKGHGTPVYGISFINNILSCFPDDACITVVKFKDRLIGGALNIIFKDTMYVPFAASLRKYFYLCPNNILYWELIKKAVDNGCRYFDFGRSTQGSGTHAFKRQWGTDTISLNYQYYSPAGKKVKALNPENIKFKILTGLWKRLPLFLANYIGPKIIKYLA